MGWWIALGILVLLAILPLGVHVSYDQDGPVIKIIAGPIRYTLIPKKKKKEKPKKEKKPKKNKKAKKAPEALPEGEQLPEEPVETEKSKKEKKSKKTEKKDEKAEKKGGSILDFLPLVDIALEFVGNFFGKTLHIDVLYVKFTMSGGDPYNLAMNYGKAWAAVGTVWSKLDEWMTIKKRDIQIQVDFEGSETLVNARVEITLTLGRLIGLAVRYGVKALITLLKILNKRKGGAQA